jgi:hypothetical protein
MAANNRSTAEFTEADGRQLAVNMLCELEGWVRKVEDRVVPSDGEDEPYMRDILLNEEPEILRRYLANMHRSGSTALERGFLCLLSHALAMAAGDLFQPQESYDDDLEPVSPPRLFKHVNRGERHG